MSWFYVYLSSRDGPEHISSSLTSSINLAPDAFQVFSSVTHHNPATIQSRQKRPIIPNSQSDLILGPTHQQTYVTQPAEQDPKFLRTLNQYASIYHQSFLKIPCGYCAILLLDHHIVWSKKIENFSYSLITILNIPLVEWVLRKGGVYVKCVTICWICSQWPCSLPVAGPWPDVLLHLP